MRVGARGSRSSRPDSEPRLPAEADHPLPREEDERDEDEAKDRLGYPQLGWQERGHDPLDDGDEGGSGDGTTERARSADQDGDERADRVAKSGVLRRNEARRIRGESARDPGDRPGDDERGKA